MSRVFIPYNPLQRDRRTGELVERLDARGKAKAEQYGELVFLFSPNVKPFNTEPLIKELREKLADFSEDDYVLMIGNPIIMSLVSTVASDASDGPIKFLQWTNGDYVPVDADLGLEECDDN